MKSSLKLSYPNALQKLEAKVSGERKKSLILTKKNDLSMNNIAGTGTMPYFSEKKNHISKEETIYPGDSNAGRFHCTLNLRFAPWLPSSVKEVPN